MSFKHFRRDGPVWPFLRKNDGAFAWSSLPSYRLRPLSPRAPPLLPGAAWSAQVSEHSPRPRPSPVLPRTAPKYGSARVTSPRTDRLLRRALPIFSPPREPRWPVSGIRASARVVCDLGSRQHPLSQRPGPCPLPPAPQPTARRPPQAKEWCLPVSHTPHPVLKSVSVCRRSG